MKLTLLIMCKNSGPIIKPTIESWLKAVDYVCILDTGSTDNTIEIIKSIKSNKIKIYEHEFEGFSDSRNRLIKLAEQKHKADYFIMIDDSYHLVEDYPGAVRSQLETAKQKGLKLLTYRNKKDDVFYYCKRIFKKGHRYQGLIHEDIPQKDDAMCEYFYINDITVDEHCERTRERWMSDIKLLKKDINPRSMFYLGNTYFFLGNYQESEKWFKKRMSENTPSSQEQTFHSALCLLNLYETQGQYDKALEICNRILNEPNIYYEDRIGEVYYAMFIYTQDTEYIKLAYEHKLGHHSLPCNENIYNKTIPELYNRYFGNSS